MKRIVLVSTAVAAVVLVSAALLWAVRGRGDSGASAGADGMAAAGETAPPGAAAAPSAGSSTPRGEVVIDARRQQLTGVNTALVTRGPLRHELRAVGVVRYDETRLADVNLRLEGWIRELYVDYTGQPIRRGQPLFTLYSPELLTTQQEYLLALQTRDQMQSSVIPDARQRADQLVASARQRLVLWELPDEEIRALDETRRAPDVVTFRSPVAGFVIEKVAMQGMHVAAGQTLYKVADLSTVWVEADIYEQELATIRVGQRATVTLEAYPGESFDGRATYVYPFVEENTRTVRVRFQFANPRGRLKPGMYANVDIRETSETGLTVPANAVIDSGAETLVFVAEGDGYFTPRPVAVGRRLGDRIVILGGIEEGDAVATSATFFLDSESQLRAGLDTYDATPATPAGGPSPAADLDITFHTTPDPPRTGDTEFEVVVKDAGGQPVAGAEVAVQMFMPAMPTMNMPAMRDETTLAPVGGGVYRGRGQVLMAGHWDVTVLVSKAGRVLGRRQLALAAR
ncbi:MAG: efflux RND transporter periplasmic adaptor subunit [Vicinamibacterales bacterium]